MHGRRTGECGGDVGELRRVGSHAAHGALGIPQWCARHEVRARSRGRILVGLLLHGCLVFKVKFRAPRRQMSLAAERERGSADASRTGRTVLALAVLHVDTPNGKEENDNNSNDDAYNARGGKSAGVMISRGGGGSVDSLDGRLGEDCVVEGND